MPRIGPEDQFEQAYLTKFKALLADHGQFLTYDNDLAALDLGLQLYVRDRSTEGPATLSQVRVWFQLKGIQASTLSRDHLEGGDQIAVRGLAVQLVRYWFAHPEPVYLVVHLEATNTFLAEDVRDLVAREGGAPWLANLADQATTTLHIDQTATLDRAVEAMPRHRSLRMDGPDFRGRPLGHNFDPLRSELQVMPPADFRDLIQELLGTHQFEAGRDVDIAAVFDRDLGQVSARVGQLYLTYEYTTPLGTEFGFGPDTNFREECKPMSAHGSVLVVVHSEVAANPRRTDAARQLVHDLEGEEIEQALVFVNASEEARLFGGWRVALEPMVFMPQGLGSLAFNVLTATNVYLEFLDRLNWRMVNYLYDRS